MMWIVLILAINFAISWWNCYAVGRSWIEANAVGGFMRLTAWCGAVQAAIGFSSVFGFIVGFVLLKTGHLPPKYAQEALDLWYVAIIVPALGTGIIITMESWRAAWRDHSLANMGTAAYNTLAMAHNIAGAASGLGHALSGVKDLFGDLLDGDSDDAKSVLPALCIALVVAALLAGIILTYVLIKHYSGTVALPRRYDGVDIDAMHYRRGAVRQ